MSAEEKKIDYAIYDRSVEISLESVTVGGRLTVPAGATNIVLFAHGSGSSRFSPRNWYVAEILHAHNTATLLMDLLSEAEGLEDQRTRHLRFDIPLLSERLLEITSQVSKWDDTKHLQISYFGSSTGAAAALIAGACYQGDIAAIVSRGGRPDLAGDYLPQVKAPTLLIVGDRDIDVLRLNEQALARLNSRSKIQLVAGATHLFEEEGTLEKVAHMASEWFKHYEGESHVL